MISKQNLSEVYSIILHMDDNLIDKIPKKFMDFIENNRDEKYIVNIDFDKSINEQELQKGTRI